MRTPLRPRGASASSPVLPVLRGLAGYWPRVFCGSAPAPHHKACTTRRGLVSFRDYAGRIGIASNVLAAIAARLCWILRLVCLLLHAAPPSFCLYIAIPSGLGPGLYLVACAWAIVLIWQICFTMDELNFDSFAQFGAENPIQGVWSDELLCLPPSEDYTKNSDATCASLPEVDPSLEGVAPFNLPTIGDHGQASLYYPTLPPTSLVGFNISDVAATAQFATGAVSNTVMNPRDLEVEHSDTDPFTLQTMPEMLLARQSQGFGLHAKHDGGWSSSGSCSGDTVPRLDGASRFSSSNGLTSDSEHILESARKTAESTPETDEKCRPRAKAIALFAGCGARQSDHQKLASQLCILGGIHRP